MKETILNNTGSGSKELVAKLRGAAQVQRQQQQGETEHGVEASDRRAEMQHSEGEQDVGWCGTTTDNYTHGGHPSGLA